MELTGETYPADAPLMIAYKAHILSYRIATVEGPERGKNQVVLMAEVSRMMNSIAVAGSH